MGCTDVVIHLGVPRLPPSGTCMGTDLMLAARPAGASVGEPCFTTLSKIVLAFSNPPIVDKKKRSMCVTEWALPWGFDFTQTSHLVA